MEKSTQIAEAINKFIDSKYAIDDELNGFDCLNCLIGFYRGLGVDIPEILGGEFEGWTLENYGERALKNPTEAHKQFEKFVSTLGKEVDVHFMVSGDLIIIKVKDVGNYAGIYLGNCNAFFMFDKGGRVCPIEPFKQHIVSIRRLI